MCGGLHSTLSTEQEHAAAVMQAVLSHSLTAKLYVLFVFTVIAKTAVLIRQLSVNV
jgi:hypothetical protein